MLQALTAWPAPKVPAFLTQGAPHPQSAEIEKILGVPLTTEGVGNFFAAALPGSVAAPMLKCYPEKNQVFMSVELRSAEGQKAANFMTVLTRKPDGSLELMRGMEEVEPEAAFFTSEMERPTPVMRLFLILYRVKAALTSIPPMAMGRTI